MKIPKQFFQISIGLNHNNPYTRRTVQLMRIANRDFTYAFFTKEEQLSAQIALLKDEFPLIVDAYERIQLLVAKIDFFRYAFLYKYGGIYLDIDSIINKPIASFVGPNDEAVLTAENNPGRFVQWMLIFNRGHPILKRTLEYVIDNILHNRFPNNVYKMTGPDVFSRAIFDIHRELFASELVHASIDVNTDVTYSKEGVSYRIFGVDYSGNASFSYPGSVNLYPSGGAHWKNKQVALLKGDEGNVSDFVYDEEKDGSITASIEKPVAATPVEKPPMALEPSPTPEAYKSQNVINSSRSLSTASTSSSFRRGKAMALLWTKSGV